MGTRGAVAWMVAGLFLAAPAAGQLGTWDSDRDLESGHFSDLIERFRGYEDRGSRSYASYRDPRAGTYTPPVPVAAPARVDQQAQLPAQRMPWSGIWWPRRPCELAFLPFSQGLSPLEKYDTLALARTGSLPGAALWEADPGYQHNDGPIAGRVDWAGHCNGAAAAAVLVPEPPVRLVVPLGTQAYGVDLVYPSAAQVPYGASQYRDQAYRRVALPGGQLELTGDDLKGWLSEIYMNCATLQFRNPRVLGTRYDRPAIDWNDPSFQDIHPHYLHYLLQEFLKNRGQSIVIEVDPHLPVNNHPAYAYQASGTRQGNLLHFTTRLWMADYAPRYQFRGTHPMVHTYTYTLQLDGSGRVVGGQWTGGSVSNHPDFVWIPVGDRGPEGTRENPRVDPRLVHHVLQTQVR